MNAIEYSILLFFFAVVIWLLWYQRRRNTSTRVASLSTPSETSTSSVTPSYSESPISADRDEIPAPLIFFEPAATLGEANTRSLSLSQPVKDALAVLAKRAPNLALKGGQLAQQSFKIVFSPAARKGFANGALALMNSAGGFRATAVSVETGKIAHQGLLVPANAMKTATVVVAAWEVLAIVTAQKYLSDINKKLAHLEKGVDGIKSRIDTDRSGKLQAQLNYLRRISQIIRDSQFSETEVAAFLNRLEGIEIDSEQIMEASRERLSKIREKASSSDYDSLGFEDAQQQIENYLDEYNTEGTAYFMAAYTRVAVCHIRSSNLPTTPSLSALRLEDIKEDISSSKEEIDKFRKFLERDAIPKVMGWFTWKETDKKAQNQLEHNLTNTHSRLIGYSNELEGYWTQVARGIENRRLAEGSQPLELLIEIDSSGNVSSVGEVLVEQVS